MLVRRTLIKKLSSLTIYCTLKAAVEHHGQPQRRYRQNFVSVNVVSPRYAIAAQTTQSQGAAQSLKEIESSIDVPRLRIRVRNDFNIQNAETPQRRLRPSLSPLSLLNAVSILPLGVRQEEHTTSSFFIRALCSYQSFCMSTCIGVGHDAQVWIVSPSYKAG